MRRWQSMSTRGCCCERPASGGRCGRKCSQVHPHFFSFLSNPSPTQKAKRSRLQECFGSLSIWIVVDSQRRLHASEESWMHMCDMWIVVSRCYKSIACRHCMPPTKFFSRFLRPVTGDCGALFLDLCSLRSSLQAP